MENCCICMGDLIDGVITSCSHRFHTDCLTEWKKVQLKNDHTLTCPVCRQELNVVSQEYKYTQKGRQEEKEREEAEFKLEEAEFKREDAEYGEQVKRVFAAFEGTHEHKELTRMMGDQGVLSFLVRRFERRLIRGKVQSGKTLMTVILALLYGVMARPVMIFTRGTYNIDVIQLRSRIAYVISTYGKSEPLISDVLMEHIQISKYSRKSFETCSVDRVVFVDEADMHMGSGGYIDMMLQFNKVYMVSATPLPLLSSDSVVKCNNVFFFRPNLDEYIDVCDIQTKEIEDTTHPSIISTIQSLEPFPIREHRIRHPRVVLVNVDYKQKNNFMLYKVLSNTFKAGTKGVVSILYGGCKEMDSNIPKWSRKVSDTESIKDLLVGMARYNEEIEVRDIVKSDENDEKEDAGLLIETILIIGSRLVDRGVNISTGSVSSCRYNWHITDEILKPYTTDISSIIQKLRCLGNYKDPQNEELNHPTLYIPDPYIHEIRDAIDLHNQLVLSCEEESTNMYSRELLKSTHVCSHQVTKNIRVISRRFIDMCTGGDCNCDGDGISILGDDDEDEKMETTWRVSWNKKYNIDQARSTLSNGGFIRQAKGNFRMKFMPVVGDTVYVTFGNVKVCECEVVEEFHLDEHPGYDTNKYQSESYATLKILTVITDEEPLQTISRVWSKVL